MDIELLQSGFATVLDGLLDGRKAAGDLADTPRRAAKFFAQCLANEGVSNEELVARYAKAFPVDYDDPVVVTGIPVFSFCEHHLALMYDMHIDAAYIPSGYVLGLSKISRLADAAARRLQLQERLTRDVAELIQMAVHPQAVVVRVSGKHSCVTARGIQKDSETFTEAVRGEAGLVNELREILKCKK